MAEQRSLRYTGSKLWNEIPYEIRNANSLNSFKMKFNAYLLEQDITWTNWAQLAHMVLNKWHIVLEQCISDFFHIVFFYYIILAGFRLVTFVY